MYDLRSALGCALKPGLLCDALAKLNFNQAVNSTLSQALGRRLYQFKADDGLQHCAPEQDLWLKLHLHGYNDMSEQGYLHELACYQQLEVPQSSQRQILLPHYILELTQYFDLSQHPAVQDHLPQALLLPDAVALFAVDASQLAADETIDLLLQSLNALEHLHQLGYLHGDIKIQHFRKWHGACYLIDFEQSIHCDAGLALARYGVTHTATPRYMAPELFHAQSKSIQSEIYALGIVWYQWLTQHRVQHASYLKWAHWHCQDFQPQLVGQFKWLEPIVLGMLSKNLAQRYENIFEIKQAITHFV